MTMKPVRKRYQNTFFLLVMLFASCSPRTFETQKAVPTDKSTETQVIPSPSPIPTSSAEVELLVTEETVLPTENILSFQHLTVKSNLPSDIKPAGTLVVSGESLQFVYFDPEVNVETVSGIEYDGCLSTSPDGKWLAYCPLSDESPTGQWLIVQSADRQQRNKVPMDTQLRYFGNYLWLDNQRLIFPLLQGEHGSQGYPMVVIDPFTGEQVRLDSNYPDFQLSPSGPASSMDFGYSDVVYDPSLNLVIFPSAIGGSYIVLWDQQTKSVLAKLDGAVGYYPLWSPDASQFVVPLLSPIVSESIIEEWFLVSKDGQLKQLTHFGEYFASAEIGPEYSWSPNGKKLAFWLNISPSLCYGLNLAVLDIETERVTNTCISGRSDYAPSPIWSLDSRYIVVVKEETNARARQTILVDIEQERAFDVTNVTGNSLPIGWLVSE